MTTEVITADRVLRKAELQFRRRLDGIGPGAHRSLRLGTGMELSDIREYVPGDDVRTIDWNVTARTGKPHVRVYDADREASILFVIDRSASMAFGTAQKTKETLLREVVAGISVLVLRRGDRIGGLLFADAPLDARPMASGRRAALRLLQLVSEREPVEGAKSRLDRALDQAGRVLRRRSIVVVCSDWIDAGAWEAPLRTLALRHEVIAVEIRDPREGELPAVGYLTLEDPETGRQLQIDSNDRALAAAYATAVTDQRAARAHAIAGTGAAHLVVNTDNDWFCDLLAFIQHRRGARR